MHFGSLYFSQYQITKYSCLTVGHSFSYSFTYYGIYYVSHLFSNRRAGQHSTYVLSLLCQKLAQKLHMDWSSCQNSAQVWSLEFSSPIPQPHLRWTTGLPQPLNLQLSPSYCYCSCSCYFYSLISQTSKEHRYGSPAGKEAQNTNSFSLSFCNSICKNMICLCKLNHVINHTEVTFEVDFWLQYFSTTIQLHILGNPISQCPSQMYIPTSFFHLLSSTGQQKMRKQGKGLWILLPTLSWAVKISLRSKGLTFHKI